MINTLKKGISIIVAVVIVSMLFIVPVGALRIEDGNAFIYDILTDETVSLVEYTSTEPNVVVPDSYLGFTVTEIKTSAFLGDNDIVSVKLPDTIQSIDQYSFANCPNLEKVVLSENITILPYFSFQNCPKLNYLYVPKSVTSMSKNIFNNSPNVVIYCYKDSYAHQFAEAKGFNYVLLDEEPEKLIGDVNLDGTVDIKDATLMQRAIADIVQFTDEQNAVADFDGNGIFNIMDVTMVQYSLVG